ncbi:MAG: hypothetical protein INR73_08005 [Williamsia sp.]|nr:hypothetical protein [Williamsia sp.]
MKTSQVKNLPVFREQPINGVASKAAWGPADIYFKWEKLLHLGFTKAGAKSSEPGIDELHAVVENFIADLENLKAVVLQKVGEAQNGSERKQLVQITQTLLTNLSNKIYRRLQIEGEADGFKTQAEILTLHLNEVLKFLEEVFGSYFNKNERVPLNMVAVKKSILRESLKEIGWLWKQDGSETTAIAGVVVQNLEAFFQDANISIRYVDLHYQQALLQELGNLSGTPALQEVREALYHLNYNNEAFFSFECNRLLDQLSHVENLKQRIAILKQEQKKINQSPVRLDYCHIDFMSSIKEQVSAWIDEEIKFLESGYAGLAPGKKEEQEAGKIHTSLSVAKLAVIIRLMVVDKIIINHSVAPVLKLVARLFSTLQKDEISFGSLETKYHSPDKATINAVRDMLFKWINILGKLG